MAISATYYLNGPSLGSSTTIYSDSGLTVVAPDGFYSDGVTSREQVSGILLPAVTCDSCGTPCGGSISGSGNQGIYLLNLDTGSVPSSVGAIIVRFDPFSFPDGIRAVYNGNNYNTLSSPLDGLHKSTNPLGFTIVGSSNSTSTCSSSWYPSGGNILLDEFLYSGNSFVSTGNSQTIAIASGDLSLSPVAPGVCVMVIPKVNPSPNIVNIELLGPCGGTVFDISVSCPALLPSFQSSTVQPTSSVSCDTALTQTFYFAKVHINADTYVGQYDFVFQDAYGAMPLPDGYYLTNNVASPNKVLHVVNGIVVTLIDCTPPIQCLEYTISTTSGQGQSFTYIDCDGNPQSGNIGGASGYDADTFCAQEGSVVGTAETITTLNGPCSPGPIESYNCVNGNCIDPGDGTGTYPTLVDCQANCASGSFAFSMINFGTDTQLEACADWQQGDPPISRTNRYSTGFTLSVGDVLYVDSGLTTIFTWPVIQYYGYAQPIPSGGIFVKWCKVDTNGTVLEVNYCV